jgi:hypothetical protein
MANANAAKSTSTVDTAGGISGWSSPANCLSVDMARFSNSGQGNLAGSSLPPIGPTNKSGLYVAMGSCPAGYFGLAQSAALYNWGDDIFYKVYARNNTTFLKVFLSDLPVTGAATPTSLGRNTPVTMGQSGSGAAITLGTTAYYSCALRQHSDLRNAGRVVYLVMMARHSSSTATSSVAGGYFAAWSSIGSTANTTDSCAA